MSAMASSANGLNSARNSCAPRTVVPAAKCQDVPVSREQGPTPPSRLPVIECETTAWAPVTSTRTPGSAIGRRSPTRRVARPPAATGTSVTLGAASGPCITVTRARPGRSSTLAMKSRSSARPLGLPVPSAQYQAVSTASGSARADP